MTRVIFCPSAYSAGRTFAMARSAKTTIAAGDESSRNPRSTAIANKPRSGDTRRANHNVVPPLRGCFPLSEIPGVPRGLVTPGYCCDGATRLNRSVHNFTQNHR